ncbi:lysylphosphatidylglycerol synthase transmembrane domain-containing protein [Natroniella sp. ANB-PHB2]|uniref:lysylphosphatidylglycerol synthase transmembrane domain-containing protein n=1 Tax=Natroniella sp. ANB-PHB2 TaxID=3384444 RepID=UPI0038D4B206
MFNKKVLLWIIGVIALTILTISTGWDEIRSIWQGVNSTVIFSLFVLQIGTLSLTAYQWYYLLRKKAPNISFRQVFSTYLAGGFVESVTPSSKLGGEAAKVYLFHQQTGLSYQELTSFLVAHKYISLLPFLLLCLLFLIIASVNFVLPKIIYISFLVFALFFGLIIWLIYNQNEKDRKQQIDQKDNSMVKERFSYKVYKVFIDGFAFISKAVCQVKNIMTPSERNWLLIISLLVWGFYPVKIYLVASVLGFSVQFILAVIVTYAAYLVSILPLSPGGLGTFEGSMAFILSINGLLFAEGLAVALLTRLVTYWFPLVLSALTAIYLITTEDIPLFANSKT